MALLVDNELKYLSFNKKIRELDLALLIELIDSNISSSLRFVEYNILFSINKNLNGLWNLSAKNPINKFDLLDKIKNKLPVILVLAWNFFEDIKKNNKDLSKKFINIKDLEN